MKCQVWGNKKVTENLAGLEHCVFPLVFHNTCQYFPLQIIWVLMHFTEHRKRFTSKVFLDVLRMPLVGKVGMQADLWTLLTGITVVSSCVGLQSQHPIWVQSESQLLHLWLSFLEKQQQTWALGPRGEGLDEAPASWMDLAWSGPSRYSHLVSEPAEGRALSSL